MRDDARHILESLPDSDLPLALHLLKALKAGPRQSAFDRLADPQLDAGMSKVAAISDDLGLDQIEAIPDDWQRI